MKLKFGLDDIMTTQEAAEDSVRNNIDIDLSRVIMTRKQWLWSRQINYDT